MFSVLKVKYQHYYTRIKIKSGKFFLKLQKLKLERSSRLENPSPVPELVQAFPYVETDGYNLFSVKLNLSLVMIF